MSPLDPEVRNARFAAYVASVMQALDARVAALGDIDTARQQFDRFTRLRASLAAAVAPADWHAALLRNTATASSQATKAELLAARAELTTSAAEQQRITQQIEALQLRVIARLKDLYAAALTSMLLAADQTPSIPSIYGALRDWLPRVKTPGAEADLLKLLSLPGLPPATGLTQLLAGIHAVGLYPRVPFQVIDSLVKPSPTGLPGEPGVQTLVYTSAYTRMSDVLGLIGSPLHTHTTRIAVTGTLILDADYTGENATGQNLMLLAGTLDLSHGNRVIDVSGKPGAAAPSQAAAPADRRANRQAANGIDGQPATVSGNVILCSGRTTGDGKLVVHANGANGGDGQPGGPGDRGESAQGGADADLSSPRIRLYETMIKRSAPVFHLSADYTAYLYEGAVGARGGAGTPGGNGGHSGQGSKPGEIHCLGAAAAESHQASGRCGQPGAAGPGGAGGLGGAGGHHGVELFSSFSRHELVQDGAPDYWCRRFFKKHWYEQASRHHPDTPVVNSPEANFSLPWAVVQASTDLIPAGYRDKVKYAHAPGGLFGPPGDDGKAGKRGGASDEDRPIANPHALDPAVSLAAFVAQLLSIDSCRNFVLQDSGVLDPGTLTPAFLYALLTDLQRREAALADPRQDAAFFAWTQPVYAGILDAIHRRRDASGVDWQVLRFFVNQKMAYAEERLAGSGVCGNQVVDLVAVNHRIATLLDATRRFSDDERRRVAHDDFAAQIDRKLRSGRSQIGVLGASIDSLMGQSSKDIASLLDQIAQARSDEQTYAADLLQKEQDLRSELENHLAFAVLGALVSVAETIAGTGAIFSELTQQLDRTVAQKAQTDVAVKELQDKIQVDQEVIKAAKDFKVQKFQPLPHMPIAVPKLLQERALGALDYDEIHRSTGETEDKVKAFVDDYQRLDAEKTALDVALHDKDELSFADFRKAEQQSALIDAKMDELLEKNEDLPRVLYTLRSAEIDQLKKENAVVTDLQKSRALDQYATLLAKERDDFETQKVIKGMQKAAETGSAIYKGVVKVLDVKKDGQAKIDAVEQALKASGEKIAALETLYQGVLDYRQGTLNATILPLVRGAQADFGRRDVFENMVAQLDFKNQMRAWTAQIKQLFGTVAASADLVTTLARVEEVLDVQLRIWDGIAAQQERQELGTLIYQLSAPQAAGWTPEQRAFLEASKLLHIKQLSELERNAFLLFSFPDGYADLDGGRVRVGVADSLDDAMAKALAQNQAIGEWLAADASVLGRADRSKEFQNLSYAALAVDGNSSLARQLLTGERVTLDLLPSDEHDIVKYITFYAHIPWERIGKLRKGLDPKTLLIDLELFGPAAFACQASATVRHVYAFGQDPVNITHSLGLVNVGRAHPIEAFSENRVSKKFGLQKLDSGRSPYCHVALQIDLDNKFREADIGADLRDQFALVFPFDRLDARVAPLIQDLQRVGWLDAAGSIARWSIIEPSTALAPLGYSGAQARWIKQALFEQSNLFGLPVLPSFELGFVGYGFYTRKGRASVSAEYEGFRVAAPGAGPT